MNQITNLFISNTEHTLYSVHNSDFDYKTHPYCKSQNILQSCSSKKK